MSHVILIAKSVTATTETVDMASPVTPGVGTLLTVIRYELEVAEVLKGQLEPGSSRILAFVVVGSSPYGAREGLPEWRVEAPLLKSDREYVIYLQLRDGRPNTSGALATRHLEFTSLAVAEFDGRVAEFAPEATVKGVTVSGNSGQPTVFGKSYALTDVRQIAASATLPLPDADARAAAQLERGAALETLLAEVAQLRTEDAVVNRMTELGLDRAVAEDPAFCRKVAGGLMQFGSPMVSLNCKDNQ